MSEMTKTVQLAGEYPVTGTVNSDSPGDMAVDISAVPAAVQNHPAFSDQLQSAVSELDRLFDAEPGFSGEAVEGVEEPLPGMTVAIEDGVVHVTNETPGDWTLLGNAQVAGQVVGAATDRIAAR